MLKRLISRREPQGEKARPTVSRKVTSPSVLAHGMHVLGNIVSEGPLDIDGKIDGNVRGESVTIRENGTIRGDVIAESVDVYGSVEGLIRAKSVTLYQGCFVSGTIMHESITIEDGATVDGKFKRIEQLLVSDERESSTGLLQHMPSLHTAFLNDNDNDDLPSEAEIRILENLRLIS